MDLHSRIKELVERNLWLYPAAYIFIFVIVLKFLGFGVLAIACCLCSTTLGASTAVWIASDSNGRFLYPLVDSWFSQRFAQRNLLDPMTTSYDKKSSQNHWKEVKIPASINDAVESLLDQLIDTYVNDWYESGISRDRDFLNEIRYQTRFACSQLLCKLVTLDLPSLLVEDFVPTAALHMHRIMKFEDNLSGKGYPRSLMETSICEAFTDLHFCLGSRRNELDYLRQIADFLLTKFLDDTHLAGRAHDDDGPSCLSEKANMSTWPSHSVRHFTRELIVNTLLLPCLDLIADPDTINHLLIMAFDAQKGDISARESLCDSGATTVPFLANFAEHTAQIVPDSLLQLKLSEVLRDARQYSTFRLYLQDTRGPVNELCFLAEASRIHASMQRKSESSSQIAYDIWQLFGQFVHDSAPDRIEFDPEVVQEFKAAVECNNLQMLDKVVETSYQVVYQRMQNEHIIPFCQSDSFLGYLCGSPPVCVNELIDQGSMPRKTSISGGTYSLAQFRSNLLRKARAMVSLDGSLDNEESVDSKLVDEEDEICSSSENAPSESYISTNIERNSSTSSLQLSSFSQLSLPSIDVSVIGDGDSISPGSGYSVTDEDDANSSASNTDPLEAEPIIDKESRNINSWKVNISRITPTRDRTTGRPVYVYVIDVERSEAKEGETRVWSIHRRFSEFYVLEMKLLEFHGESLRFTLLPPKKTLVSRNRAFLEQHRLLFSLFLSSLCKQKMLHRSDLLFAFLTSHELFRQNLLLSDLNPWKVVKKMPGKLGREKGQHLRPFLLTLLANTLCAQEKVNYKEKNESSDSSSLSSVSMAPDNYSTAFYNPLFGNNCNGCSVAEEDNGNSHIWTRSLTDSMSLLLFSIVAQTSQWVLNIQSALRIMCRNTFDCLMLRLLTKGYESICNEQNIALFVQFIQTTIFCSDGQMPSDQEKSLREELALRRALEFVQEEMPSPVLRMLDSKSWRGGIKRLVNTLQYPRLNKHLSYLLLDLLIAKLFPEYV